MPVFAYQALDANSRSRKGLIEADSPKAARRLLVGRGLRPAQLSPETSSSHLVGSWLGVIFGRLSALRQRKQVLEALENLVTMLQSGLNLEAAWGTLAGFSSNSKSRTLPVLHRLHDAISMGVPMSEAMEKHPRIFDAIDVALVRAGEDSGELAAVLSRLVARKQLASKLSAAVLGAVAYPLFLMFFGSLVVLFLSSYVIPDINAMLIAGGGQIPFLTRCLQAAGLVLGLGLLPALLAGVLLFLFLLRRYASLKQRLINLVLRLPVIGSGWLNWQLCQLCLVLRTLVASGVQLPSALELAAKACGEGPVAQSAKDLQERLLEGHDLGDVPPDQGGLPPWLWRALAVGQETGELATVLERSGSRFETLALRQAARLGQVLEPALILLVGIFIALVAYGALLPIVKLGSTW